VIDSAGEVSEQIDVVIYDRYYSPLLFNDGGTLYVPAESVYAVLEVKPEFTRDYFNYAGDKVASVRRLHRTSTAIPTYRGPEPSRSLFPIAGGILALESSWNPPFGDAFSQSLLALEGERQLDIGCALRHGAFDLSAPPEREISLAAQETSLIFFLLRLSRRLQNMANVPAIDLIEYGRKANL
jgi:hypothetical protein